MLTTFVLILFVSLEFATSKSLVPNVKVFDSKKNGYQLESFDDGYQLVVKDTGSSRIEYVEEVEPGELSVAGQYRQQFNNQIQLVVQYVAGRDGYVARYKMKRKNEIKKTPQRGSSHILITTGCLKACVG